ncbi:hypothetical protein H632_c479p1 [Helicosporidium sp. ATCC 50920]|nr:hypothetical protein H632_c479p1 [Helicosporidium sp. ATCC 50920]|eukprot:KDD75833.1 hypothetical protein H632_c479p1 [Helicosporidium sp. ATCC 50920]
MSAEDTRGEVGAPSAEPVNKNKRHRKEKPWDHEGIDHWKIDPFTKEENPHGMQEESSFAILFPKYREQYLRESWPLVTRTLKEHGIGCELNLVEGSMTVKTTRKTFDPYIIMKARDVIKLLARSVPAAQALLVLNDDMQCDIIKIGGLVRNKDKFAKRRQRLIGPNGATLKALELLTNCYILVQGTTVAAMGDFKGLKQVRRVVEDCLKNMHPIYHIKIMMVRRELAKDPTLATENWDRFLPKFKKKNVQSRKPFVVREKKEYTPFPPAPMPRKEDIQMATGEYFLSAKDKKARADEARAQSRAEKGVERQKKRDEAFVPPSEEKKPKKSKKNAALDSGDVHALAESLKSKLEKKGDANKRKASEGEEKASKKKKKSKE